MVAHYTLAEAGVRDLPVLVNHRHGMFSEIGRRSEISIRRHDARYRAWALERLRRGELAGVMARDRRGKVVASGCVWFREEQPRPETARIRSAYILSVYTDRSARRQGLASAVVRRLVVTALRRGYGRVNLHASRLGGDLYERLGFERTNEMRLILDPGFRAVAKRHARERTKGRARLRRARRGRPRVRGRGEGPERTSLAGGASSSGRPPPAGRRRTGASRAGGKGRRPGSS